ncbi:MAG: YhbY family RNA-binding protein [Longimicrobiales bacterium]|nr:YhbY family RNA-binding protein [Longimicrobiales bacterium]
MTELTSRQRAFLRSRAHALKPILQIGAGGLTPAVLDAVRDAFNQRELLKVKVLESAPEGARDVGAALTAALENVHVAQTIGRTVVLYRPFPKDPEIVLP